LFDTTPPLVLIEEIPANSSFVDVSTPSGWSCEPPDAGAITCTGPALNGLASVSLVFTLVADEDLLAIDTIDNTVTVTTAAGAVLGEASDAIGTVFPDLAIAKVGTIV